MYYSVFKIIFSFSPSKIIPSKKIIFSLHTRLLYLYKSADYTARTHDLFSDLCLRSLTVLTQLFNLIIFRMRICLYTVTAGSWVLNYIIVYI